MSTSEIIDDDVTIPDTPYEIIRGVATGRYDHAHMLDILCGYYYGQPCPPARVEGNFEEIDKAHREGLLSDIDYAFINDSYARRLLLT